MHLLTCVSELCPIICIFWKEKMICWFLNLYFLITSLILYPQPPLLATTDLFTISMKSVFFFFFFRFHILGRPCDTYFSVWFISISVIPSRAIQGVTNSTLCYCWILSHGVCVCVCLYLIDLWTTRTDGLELQRSIYMWSFSRNMSYNKKKSTVGEICGYKTAGR